MTSEAQRVAIEEGKKDKLRFWLAWVVIPALVLVVLLWLMIKENYAK